jgi:hypothetical protein
MGVRSAGMHFFKKAYFKSVLEKVNIKELKKQKRPETYLKYIYELDGYKHVDVKEITHLHEFSQSVDDVINKNYFKLHKSPYYKDEILDNTKFIQYIIKDFRIIRKLIYAYYYRNDDNSICTVNRSLINNIKRTIKINNKRRYISTDGFLRYDPVMILYLKWYLLLFRINRKLIKLSQKKQSVIHFYFPNDIENDNELKMKLNLYVLTKLTGNKVIHLHTKNELLKKKYSEKISDDVFNKSLLNKNTVGEYLLNDKIILRNKVLPMLKNSKIQMNFYLDLMFLLPLVYRQTENMLYIRSDIGVCVSNYELLENNDNIRTIKTENEITQIIQDIYHCNIIVTDSLLVLVLSHLYGIQALMVNLTDGKNEINIDKFRSYLEFVHIKYYTPPVIKKNIDKSYLIFKDLIDNMNEYMIPNIDFVNIQKLLIKNFPFKIKKQYSLFLSASEEPVVDN